MKNLGDKLKAHLKKDGVLATLLYSFKYLYFKFQLLVLFFNLKKRLAKRNYEIKHGLTIAEVRKKLYNLLRVCVCLTGLMADTDTLPVKTARSCTLRSTRRLPGIYTTTWPIYQLSSGKSGLIILNLFKAPMAGFAIRPLPANWPKQPIGGAGGTLLCMPLWLIVPGRGR